MEEDKQNKEEASSSKENKEKKEETKDSSISSDKEEVSQSKTTTPSTTRASPESRCLTMEEDKQNKEEASSSKENKEKKEETKDSSISSDKEEVSQSKTTTPSTTRASPESRCLTMEEDKQNKEEASSSKENKEKKEETKDSSISSDKEEVSQSKTTTPSTTRASPESRCLTMEEDKQNKEEASSSKENKEKKEETKDSSISSDKEVSQSETPTPSTTRASPESRCPICLEQMDKESYTDSCFHMFCFTCLVKWSKVKPECPLCKQSFKSIVHNVRSYKDYDQYYVNKPRESESIWDLIPPRRVVIERFQVDNRMMERIHINNRVIEREIASHRMRYAPHSVHPVRMDASQQTVRHIPCSVRRRIYEENLWVRRQPSDRHRCISPYFFRRRIACTHRLLPWLNRELLVVMPNNESQISFVVELILALLVRYDITSREFFTHIIPYTAAHTAHFIHEFYNFATSPYESMETYDLHAQYGMSSYVQTVSSPDSDVIPPPVNEMVALKSGSSETKREEKHVKEHKSSANSSRSSSPVSSKIILRRKSGNCWSSSVVPNNSVPFANHTDVSNSNPFEVPGPSTSRDTTFIEFSTETSNPDLDESNEVERLADPDDDECQIVEVLKPSGERTPEIVNLSSEDETIAQPIHSAQSEADHIVFLSETKVSESATDKPIDYSMKTSANEVSESASKSQEGGPSPSSSQSNVENETVDPQKKSIIESAIRTLNNDNDTCSSSWSPVPRPKKRKAVELDDSSSESSS